MPTHLLQHTQMKIPECITFNRHLFGTCPLISTIKIGKQELKPYQ